MAMSVSQGFLLALIGILFLKPDELRRMARTAGQWITKIRRMSNEFKSELIREADLQDLRDQVRQFKSNITESIDDLKYTLDEPHSCPGGENDESRPHEMAEKTAPDDAESVQDADSIQTGESAESAACLTATKTLPGKDEQDPENEIRNES